MFNTYVAVLCCGAVRRSVSWPAVKFKCSFIHAGAPDTLCACYKCRLTHLHCSCDGAHTSPSPHTPTRTPQAQTGPAATTRCPQHPAPNPQPSCASPPTHPQQLQLHHAWWPVSLICVVLGMGVGPLLLGVIMAPVGHPCGVGIMTRGRHHLLVLIAWRARLWGLRIWQPGRRRWGMAVTTRGRGRAPWVGC